MQVSPTNITCGVTKSSVSEPERVWSADAREVLEPCRVMDEAVALQEEKNNDKIFGKLSWIFGCHQNSHLTSKS